MNIDTVIGDASSDKHFYDLLSSLKDRVKKLTTEKEALDSHLKNEKDEKELYKVISWWYS